MRDIIVAIDAGHGGDDLVALHKPRQCQAQFGEFRIPGPHPAHGDETDLPLFHRLAISFKAQTAPVIRLMTGIANSAWAFLQCAMTTQQTGMAAAPITNAHDAVPTHPPSNGASRAVK